MIDCRISDSEVASLEGRIIFHAAKGADVSSVLLPLPTVKIGGRLGKVSRINGAHRIFYVAADGSEKFVSTRGIGYICDTDAEAQALETIRDEITDRIRASVAAAHAEMEDRVKALVVASGRNL